MHLSVLASHAYQQQQPPPWLTLAGRSQMALLPFSRFQSGTSTDLVFFLLSLPAAQYYTT